MFLNINGNSEYYFLVSGRSFLRSNFFLCMYYLFFLIFGTFSPFSVLSNFFPFWGILIFSEYLEKGQKKGKWPKSEEEIVEKIVEKKEKEGKRAKNFKKNGQKIKEKL